MIADDIRMNQVVLKNVISKIIYLNHEIIIHHRIEQRVNQIVGSRFSNFLVTLSDALAHLVEQIALVFNECQKHIAAQHNA